MCGITGWIDFQRHFPERSQIVDRMTDSLSHRGPDARGTWYDSYAALGHRRLSIIDVEHGVQPMLAQNREGQTSVVAFNGQIFNFRELRSQLVGYGYTFETNSDTEVLLKGYLHWKERVAEHLNGMFAIAIWDVHRQQLTLIRDRLGVKPLYYYQTDTGIVFGSEPKALFENPYVNAQVSNTGFCEILDMVKTPELTPYDGMYEVRPGHILTFNRQGLKKQAYWQLSAREHHDSLDVTIATVREILSDTVKRQMISDVPICSLLSGGLDSSAITALAVEHVEKGQFPSFSVDFTHNMDNFSADGVRGAPDAPFARALAEHVGTAHTELLLNSNQMLENSVRNLVLHGVDAPPAYWGDMWPSLYLLFQGIKKHSTVALSGEAADEVFGGYQWFRNPAAISANTFPWLTAGSSRYFGGIQLLNRDFVHSLNRDEYRDKRYQEALAEVPVLAGEAEDERRLRQVSYLALTRFLPTLLDRNDRMSMAVGLEVRVPFCDHRLVDYVFNAPWSMKTYDGREKSLLRAATAPLLPDSIVHRVKTPYPATQDRSYEQGLRDELAGLMDDTSSPARDFIDSKKAKLLIDRGVSEISQPYNRGGIEMALWMNRWLEKYDVTTKV
ncbi:asparagine synthase (glutamine-hydrolyzing) [Photobacterium lutimaris]|uniref:asparagine synthase (glutamine-hydrolyzing) n=1 Tax=Photobacterium lutimaris TaxID=388278 RepID=A0A2T3IWM7_9GAMM|nr:asparagine synthase (glutamine-hydrolyzing) [Photobacterium lutimaris]PSU32891.1 asparagine synthase (glutamine-hydrolyzing) [Photobacterium lutimaris]TDR74123.1 asparagine synthase (glutamine-hydrolysing)/amidotransferase [Photobacterium lutimaris]